MIADDGSQAQYPGIGFQHEIKSPRDVATGTASGKRQHKPFTVIKPVDKASLLLMQAMIDNRRFTSVQFTAWRPGKTGQEEQFYTIQLENATITSISRDRASAAEDIASTSSSLILEKVEIVYDEITFRLPGADGVITDSWSE